MTRDHYIDRVRRELTELYYKAPGRTWRQATELAELHLRTTTIRCDEDCIGKGLEPYRAARLIYETPVTETGDGM